MPTETGRTKRLGIVVGGGPAPGINGVIAAVVLEGLKHGLEVVGVYDGFKHLAAGDETQAVHLTCHDADRIRARGGSYLRTARENPTADPAKMSRVVETLQRLRLDYLVTIGGDDTAFSAMRTAEIVGGAIRVAHVPKTIDNDLPLPDDVPTFGFTTARDVGARTLASLHEDVRVTGRWAIVVTQGRSAGHLALGIGSAAAANITVIGEEFRSHTPLPLAHLCATLEGAIFKARTMGRSSGVAVVAEGLCDLMVPDLAAAQWSNVVRLKYDEFQHVHVSDVPLALILTRVLQDRAQRRGDHALRLIYATLGYELRCADPVPFDVQYTQALGWGAVRYLLNHDQRSWTNDGAMITLVHGELKPEPFDTLIDRKTKKTRVRWVDLQSDAYAAAREQMIRLEAADFADPRSLAELAQAAGLTVEQFRAAYQPVVDPNLGVIQE